MENFKVYCGYFITYTLATLHICYIKVHTDRNAIAIVQMKIITWSLIGANCKSRSYGRSILSMKSINKIQCNYYENYYKIKQRGYAEDVFLNQYSPPSINQCLLKNLLKNKCLVSIFISLPKRFIMK